MACRATTRAMLIDDVRAEFSVSKAEATQIVDFLFSHIAESLSRGIPVNITNFGTFSVKEHKGHFVQSGHHQVGSDAGDRQYRRIDDYRVIRFVPSVRLKQRVNTHEDGDEATQNIGEKVSRKVRSDSKVTASVGRPKKVLTDEERMKRDMALRMIREDMKAGIAVTTKSVADKTGAPIHLVTKWRNEADLSVKEVKEKIREHD